jgi:hypothetical protein
LRSVAGGMALAGSALLPNAAAAQAGLGPAADLLATTWIFVANLDDGKRRRLPKRSAPRSPQHLHTVCHDLGNVLGRTG